MTQRFLQQLPAYFTQEHLPEENSLLQERVRKGAAYFQTVLGQELLPLLHSLPTDCDNKQVRELLLEATDELEKELFSKLRSFESCREGFGALPYLQARNRAELDFQPERKKHERQSAKTEEGSARGGLYGALMKWRNDLAGEKDTSTYLILPQKAIVELVRLKPTTADELLAIKGFGKTKVKQIGAEVLAIIQAYGDRPKAGGRSTTPTEKTVKEPKIPSITLTLALFQMGKTVAEVAAERGLSVSTVESHLTQCIGKGELALEAILAPGRIALIRNYLDANRPGTLSEAVQGIGQGVTYSEIRMVLSAIQE